MRILLADMTAMLASIVSAAFAQAPDLEVAGRASAGRDLAAEIRQTRADALVLESPHPDDSDLPLTLLRSFPALRIVAITANCQRGFLHELRPQVTQLDEISAAALAAAVRGAAAPQAH